MIVTNKRERDERGNDIIKVAIGATAAAVAFKKTGLRKFADEASRAFRLANKDIGREVASKSFRDFDYKTIKGVYNKHIKNSDSNFQKSFNRKAPIKISTKSGFAKTMAERKALELNKMGLARKAQDAHLRTRVLNKAHDILGPKTEKEGRKINQAVMAALRNQKKYMLKNSDDFSVDMTPAFYKMLKGTSIESRSDEIANIIAKTYEEVNSSGELSDVSSKFIGKTFDEITKKLDLEIAQSSKKSDFFKNVLGKANIAKEILEEKGEGHKITIDDIFQKRKEIRERYKGSTERVATIKDLLEAKDNGTEFDDSTNDLIEDIISFKKKNKKNVKYNIDDVIISDDLRIFNGELYTSNDYREVVDGAKEGFADTIPGKLFGVRSFLDKGKAPIFHMFGQGSFDATLTSLTKSKNGLLENNFAYIMGKTYKINPNGSLDSQAFEGMELMSGVHGVFDVLNNRLHGNFQYRENSNKLMDILSINTTGNNAVEKFKSRFTKFSEDGDWQRKRINSFLDGNDMSQFDYYLGSSEETSISAYNVGMEISNMFDKTLRAPTDKEALAIANGFNTENAKIIAQSLLEDDPLEYLQGSGVSLTKNLENIIKRQEKNPNYIDSLVKIGDLGSIDGMNVLRGKDIIRREIIKSSMQAENVANTIGSTAETLEKINGLDISANSKEYLSRVLHWNTLEETGKYGIAYSNMELSIEQIEALSKNVNAIVNDVDSTNAQNKHFINSFKDEVRKIVRENTSIFEEGDISHPDAINGYKGDKWSSIQKTRTLSPLQIIEDINNYTMNEGMKATETDTWKFINQFFAGRDNVENITLATLLPYHMINRLVTPMEKFGIGFDPRHTGSVGSLAFNIMARRVIPIGLGMTALSYLNFESEQLTGTSFTEAFENSKANSTLGLKKLQGAVGMSNNIDRNRRNNPITSYLLGDYEDEEEYLDYLEYGSDPVRKGRYWSFGSTSEFRGGKIAYWEPNKLRQAHSNYKDIALYGSSEEKWSRSLMPSLRYPLSPLKYLMNPYWVEDLNYDSRPYPVSGKMFAEGTPWGAVLNPTVGALIKPQKRMHREDMYKLNDSRSIINEINKAIKNNAKEGSIARMDETGVTPIGLSPKGMPSLNEAVMSYRLGDNEINVEGVRGADFAESIPNFNHAVIPTDSGGSSSYQSIVGETNNAALNSVISIMNNKGYNYGERVDPNLIISQINNEIKNAGSVDDVITTERARLFNTPIRDNQRNAKEDYYKSLNLNSSGDAVFNAMSSAKELSGMYGFLFEQIMPSKKGYRLAEAGSMTSFSRGFWDENIGGMGGDFMEIARRFFPHENHDIKSINPLRNTQPLWLPEKFATGDPYTSLPKGEARLPGRGYEALNKLHGDEYGKIFAIVKMYELTGNSLEPNLLTMHSNVA